MPPFLKRIGMPVLFIAICEIAGALGTVFTADAIPGWYATLVRPEFAPPNWVFGPVWTLLYAFMGIAAFLVWRQRGKRTRAALLLFWLQLALNAAWTPLFFGLQAKGLALAELALLWIAILATIVAFKRVSRTAAWLLVPYLAWVSFACYLNASFWLLN